MPTTFQGAKLRGGKDPVLRLTNPGGGDRQLRREILNDLDELNSSSYSAIGDPEKVKCLRAGTLDWKQA
jgi:hypothetical protein